ncbi:hypothetical protein [Mucilaginibacter sp.]
MKKLHTLCLVTLTTIVRLRLGWAKLSEQLNNRIIKVVTDLNIWLRLRAY